MRHKIFSLFTTGIILIVLISCNRPECTNSNPIFDEYPPTSKEYKDELVKQLSLTDSLKLTYWLEKYIEINGQEYLQFYIQGDGICAKLVLTMKQWNKLDKVREKKGISYRGAEFTNLKFDIFQDSSNTEFVYRDFKRIID